MSKKAFDKIAAGLNDALAMITEENRHDEIQTGSAPRWQPIETAPPDKPILGFQMTPGDWENQMNVCWAMKAPDGSHIWIGVGGLTPTHWMPLPEPPK